MLTTLGMAAFLLAHASIHAGYLAQPPMTPGGPAWPFDLRHSWILTPLGLDGAGLRLLGVALVAATAAGFSLAAIATLGVTPSNVWVPAVAIGAASSLALIIAFFHPWLIAGVAIDLVLLWVVLIAGLAPAGIGGSR